MGPMGTRYVISAKGTIHTASGHQRVFSRSPAINAYHRRLYVWSLGCGFLIGSDGINQEQRDHGLGRKAR